MDFFFLVWLTLTFLGWCRGDIEIDREQNTGLYLDIYKRIDKAVYIQTFLIQFFLKIY
jgi:hypothetical protein